MKSQMLIKSILKKYNGGEIESFHEPEEIDDLDLLSDEDDTEEHDEMMAAGGEVNNPKLAASHEVDPKKKILQGVMDRIRARHMGR